MLEAAILLQIGIGAYVESAVIAALLLFNATLGFIQEGRAGAALAALKQRLAPTALVCRDGTWARIAASELVPGDAIRLTLGALVPADATLVSGSVMVDQSMLTGESLPVDAGPGSRGLCGFAGAPRPGHRRSDRDRRQDQFRPHGRTGAHRPRRKHGAEPQFSP